MKKYTTILIIILVLSLSGFIVSGLIINGNRTAFGYDYKTLEGDSRLVEDLSFRFLIEDGSNNYQYWDASYQMKSGKAVLTDLAQYSESKSKLVDLRSQVKKQLNQYGTINLSFSVSVDDQQYYGTTIEEEAFVYENMQPESMKMNQRYYMNESSSYIANLYLYDFSDRYKSNSFYLTFPDMDVSGNDYYAELSGIKESQNSTEYLITRTEPAGFSLSEKEGTLIDLNGSYYFTIKNTLYMNLVNLSSHRSKTQNRNTSSFGSSSGSASESLAIPEAKWGYGKDRPPFHYKATSGIWCITPEEELVNLYPLEITDESDFTIRHLSAVPETNSLILLIEKENALYATNYHLDTDTVDEEVLLYRFPEGFEINNNPFTAYPDGKYLNLVYETDNSSFVLAFNTVDRKVEAECDLTGFAPDEENWVSETMNEAGEKTDEFASRSYNRRDIRYINGRFNILYSIVKNQNFRYTEDEYCLCTLENGRCVYRGILSLNLLKEDTEYRPGYNSFSTRRIDYLVFD